MTKTYNKLVRDRIPEIIASDGKTCTVEVLSDSRYADFALESNGRRVAIEIDDEASHHKGLVASGKFSSRTAWSIWAGMCTGGRCGRCSSSRSW